MYEKKRGGDSPPLTYIFFYINENYPISIYLYIDEKINQKIT